MAQPSQTFVDPAVSRAKFAREVAAFRERKGEHQRRGCLLVEAEFPEVLVVFVSPHPGPLVALFGVQIDFRNYDVWPPSVKFVHPLTRVPYKMQELPMKFIKRAEAPQPTENNGTAPPVQAANGQALLQAWGDDREPFFCLPGVREYHDNPGHSGDSWLMHRRKGEGSLDFILTQIHRYGVNPIRPFYQINILFPNVELPT